MVALAVKDQAAETADEGAVLLEELLPLARKGLEGGGVASEDFDLYLGVVEERVRTKQTGSQWFHLSLAGMKGKGTEAERMSALTASLVRQQKEGISTPLIRSLSVAGKGWKFYAFNVGCAVCAVGIPLMLTQPGGSGATGVCRPPGSASHSTPTSCSSWAR